MKKPKHPVTCVLCIAGIVFAVVSLWQSNAAWYWAILLTIDVSIYCIQEHVAPLFGCVDCEQCAGVGKVLPRVVEDRS